MKIRKKTLMVTGVLLLAAVFVISYFAFTPVAARAVVHQAQMGDCNNPPSGSCTSGQQTCVEGAGASNACVYKCGSGGTWTKPGTACSYSMCDGGSCAGEGSISADPTADYTWDRGW
jgi:hypothetical protein